ncbi:MAG: DUF1653 domain-containing protein [Agathobacter sp.]|nr:DUF1653 domain-containing protein [Agathobacter sp.]MDD6353668.1 DUF1653 domain-containing protein [Lachnospiraceae bacterium]MDD7204929.1 DUF1653 domain-containing protein [Lachnospiraceae bacterium]MEE1216297.1 DUF1653 domain-containing protein [Agathobacter sp.]
MDRTPKPGELYRHFKNKLYQIVTVATHSETGEKLVIYQALYDNFGVYARPLDMFVSEVDHEKYPDVKQKYRFERITPQTKQTDTQVKSEAVRQSAAKMPEAGSVQVQTSKAQVADADDDQAPNPQLIKFLDADTLEEKYNILVSMSDTITDRLLDDMAVVMDVVLPEAPLMERYEDLKNIIRTRQHYEFANRLR